MPSSHLHVLGRTGITLAPRQRQITKSCLGPRKTKPPAEGRGFAWDRRRLASATIAVVPIIPVMPAAVPEEEPRKIRGTMDNDRSPVSVIVSLRRCGGHRRNSQGHRGDSSEPKATEPTILHEGHGTLPSSS